MTTVNGKDITRAFYGKRANYSYYVGCSKGGQQGLMQAQRYPEDYDGIIAGDPANNWTRFYAGSHLWYSIATLKDPESYIPPTKTSILGDAVTAACDAIDGIKDGVLDDPRKCKFNPAVLTCKPNQNPDTCYTPKQVQAIKDIWSGVRTSRGKVVHPRSCPAAKQAPAAGPHGPPAPRRSPVCTGWRRTASSSTWCSTTRAAITSSSTSTRTWRSRCARSARSLDAVDPNLRPFERRGGKLIVYHGWSDPDISPLNTIDYFESVVEYNRKRHDDRGEALARTQDFFRLFMVPGMQHCSGGPGPNTFDALTALEDWVENGEAPRRIVASRSTNGVVDRTRPLCVYPKVAVYKGEGSTDAAENFVCRTPREE